MILCVNPWIDDFTAYDLWAKPLGLIEIASWLKQNGFDVAVADLLYQHYPELSQKASVKMTGRGNYLRREIPRPELLKHVSIPRKFYQYGMSKEDASALLSRYPRPRLILLTSMMTYWYSGLRATVDFLKKTYPEVPVIGGGIYTRLCRNHALRVFDDIEIAPQETYSFLRERVRESTGHAPLIPSGPFSISPDYTYYPSLPYIPLRFTRGCPYRCRYCAGPLLEPRYIESRLEKIKLEFEYGYKKGIKDFVFYDDALLFSKERLLHPFLKWIEQQGMKARFHTPNGLHVALFDEKTLALMRAAGEWEFRFGVETLIKNQRQPLDVKTDWHDLQQLAALLLKEEFNLEHVRIYLLAGLPGQPRMEVEESIKMVKGLGLRPIPNEYSPIPGTPLFNNAVKSSVYDLQEPLFQNKSIVPCSWEEQTWRDVQELKELARS